MSAWQPDEFADDPADFVVPSWQDVAERWRRAYEDVSTQPRYDRKVLVEVLVYHQQTNTSGCHCGWAVLGASYAEHVADVYEASITVRTT